MSEGSLHPIGSLRLRSFPSAFIKRTLGRLAGRRRRQERETAPGPGSSSLAAVAIREFAEAHATLFERAERLGEKAERLAHLGMPSESASNRAERARREVEASLAALRTSLVESLGTSEGGRAFDREVERRYPSFALPGSDL